MEAYPEELRTPPVSLVAVVGIPELHPQISMSLHTEQPPINTLALPDFSKVPAVGGKERRPVDALMPPPRGILKSDWMLKHRTRVPAVLIVLFDREKVNGSPSEWMEVCGNLDNVKSVIRGRNTKLVVAIVQPGLYGEINDERLTALRKRAEVDAKSFLTFISHDPVELKRSLARLGSVLSELSSLFYREEGRRIKSRIDKKSFTSQDLGVRYGFKMAYYAEFRRDWTAALRGYETAYTLLQEVVTTPAENQSVQRVVEVKAVAEQLHFKVSTLLLHSGREADAVKWFKQHITRYKKVPGPPEGVFLHWSWLSQQYHVFGELLESSLSAAAASSTAALIASGLSEREMQPGFYYQVAAGYMRRRRQSFEMAFTAFETFEDAEAIDVLDGPPEAVGPPLYVGQGPCVLSRDSQSPSADEYLRHAMLTEKRFPYARAVISLLTRAHEQYKIIRASRMMYYLGSEMGREYFHVGEHENSRRLFDSVARMFRKEGWVLLLGNSLGYLRESARQLGLLKEYIEYSLELAALPIFAGPEMDDQSTGKASGPAGPLCLTQRVDVYKEAVAIMQGVQTILPVRDGEPGISVADSPIVLEIDLVSSLRSVLSVCVTFHEQAVKPGSEASLTISLLTHLPGMLILSRLELQFNQPACNISLGDSLELEPCKWKRITVSVVPVRSGKLECISAIASFGHASIRCQVESPASREPDALWVLEPMLDAPPVKDVNLLLAGQRVIQVEEPDALVDVTIEASAPALLGESFPVRLCVQSMGHDIQDAELQVSTREESTGNPLEGFSPITPAGGPSPATIFIPASIDEEVLLWELKDSIKVPAVEVNGSWSTNILIRWTEAVPITLNVSLCYQTPSSSAGEDEQSHQLWVHKSFVLQCEGPLGIDCRYMAPYRRTAYLPSSASGTTGVVLPMNETSTLVVSVKSTCSVPVCVFPIQVEEKSIRTCQVKRPIEPAADSIKLFPGEAFNEAFWVIPAAVSSSLDVGELVIKWEREDASSSNSGFVKEVPQVSRIDELLIKGPSASSSPKVGSVFQGSTTTTRVPIPPVDVEKALLVISLHSPAYGVLGVPMMVSYEVQNRTKSLQELSFSVVDAHSFLVSGASRGSISILPGEGDRVSLKVVPIASGMVQLPQVMLTSVQCGAKYQPSASSSQIFVFPAQPRLKPQSME